MANPLHDNPRSKEVAGESEKDAMDYSDKHNTKLSDDDEAKYQKWAKANKREKDTYDYDMRGAWKENGGKQSDNGHFPDTYKKPNHPTFSDESKYHGTDGNEGGKWSKNGDRDIFTPGKTNKALRSKEERQEYLKRSDPNVDLSEGDE